MKKCKQQFHITKKNVQQKSQQVIVGIIDVYQNVKVHSTKLETILNQIPESFVFFRFPNKSQQEKALINLNKFNPSDIDMSAGKGKRNVALFQVFMT